MGGIRFSGNTNPAGISQNTATSKRVSEGEAATDFALAYAFTRRVTNEMSIYLRK